MRNLLIFALLCMPSIVIAQGRIQGPPIEQDPLYEDNILWRQSKKLSLDPSFTVNNPEVNRGGQGWSARVDKLTNDQVTLLQYWRFTVKQVLDENSMILQCGDWPSIILEGYSTKDIVDDENVAIMDYVKVTGIKEITTVLGAKKRLRTVKMLTPEESKEYEKTLESKGYHHYGTNDGTTKRAKFDQVIGDKVCFVEYLEGSWCVPIANLTPESFELLKAEAAKRGVIIKAQPSKTKPPEDTKPAKKEPKKRKGS